MLQKELCQHPDIQTVAYSSHTYLETHHWTKAAVLLGSSAYPGYGSRSNARKYLVDTLRGNLPDFVLPKDDRELVFSGWEAMCHHFAQPVFFEKSPQLLGDPAALDLFFQWVRETHFQVKILGLVRNPMAVQYSAYQLFHTSPDQRQFGWKHIQENLLQIQKELPAEQFCLIKYEDLILTPEDTFSAICKFIGRPPHTALGASTHRVSLNKWREDPFFTLQLAEDVQVLAETLGYSSEDLRNPPKKIPPLYRRFARELSGRIKLARTRLVDRVIRPLFLKK